MVTPKLRPVLVWHTGEYMVSIIKINNVTLKRRLLRGPSNVAKPVSEIKYINKRLGDEATP